MSKYIQSMSKFVRSVRMPSAFKLSQPSKISKKSKSAFSIPAGPKFACPGATKACDGCYAMKGRHHFGNVQSAFARNWKLLRKFEKKNDAVGAAKLIAESISKTHSIFRIHESGDFHSQWAADMWAEVVKKRQDIQFWTYTRSFELNFNSLTRQKNFALWASTDDYNLAEARKFVRKHRKSGVKHAYGPWDLNKKLPKKSFVCPVTNGKMNVEGACEKCMLCVANKRTKNNVVFIAH